MDVPDGHIYGYDANVFLKNIRPKIVTKLKNELGNLKNLKFQLALKVLMVKHILNKQSKGVKKNIVSLFSDINKKNFLMSLGLIMQ